MKKSILRVLVISLLVLSLGVAVVLMLGANQPKCDGGNPYENVCAKQGHTCLNITNQIDPCPGQHVNLSCGESFAAQQCCN
jgi:hypothetical protein